MPQNHKKREEARALRHAGRVGHYAAAGAPGGTSVPRDIRAVAQMIENRRLPGLVDRHGKPREAYAETKVGRSGDEFERVRRMVAKGMPHAEFTDAYGVSRAPHLKEAA